MKNLVIFDRFIQYKNSRFGNGRNKVSARIIPRRTVAPCGAPGDTPCIIHGTRVASHIRAHIHARVAFVHVTARLQGRCFAPSLWLLYPTTPPPSCFCRSFWSPVFMRVSMGKGSSATRTRRKIISDLPRARDRSCRPPYIARRSVLCAPHF